MFTNILNWPSDVSSSYGFNDLPFVLISPTLIAILSKSTDRWFRKGGQIDAQDFHAVTARW